MLKVNIITTLHGTDIREPKNNAMELMTMTLKLVMMVEKPRMMITMNYNPKY
jgi:hypothetical protein